MLERQDGSIDVDTAGRVEDGVDGAESSSAITREALDAVVATGNDAPVFLARRVMVLFLLVSFRRLTR